MSTEFLIPLALKIVYSNRVPNQRAAGQKLLPVAVDEKFLHELDAGLAQAGYRNRSQFIRDAIVEKLTRAGIVVPKELVLPPHRIGKSAEATSRHPPHWPAGFRLNKRAKTKKRRAK